MTETYRPTAGVAVAAKRALEWIADGKAGSGFTAVGRQRAVQLANRHEVSLETVRRMFSFFSRHEVDKKGKDFDNLSDPSPGRVAWDAWGGDAGYSWAKRIVESVKEKTVTSQTSVFVPILKFDKQDDGTLLVHGVATDSTLDSDKQVCDNDWLKSAMPSWFRWGNIREQHSNIAAGVATEYEEKDGQHWITARVVDPSSVKKVETRTLKGFSIGIHSPRVVRDEKAAGGRIVDGEIVEVSLVDRPANPSCTLSLAKAAGGLEEVLVKREVSAGERSRLADTGDAMPDGSFPIANRADLKNAILAFGRAKNPAAVRRHIMRRAKELGAENLLPAKWTGRTDKMDEMTGEESTGEESTGSVEESSAPPAKKAAEVCDECGKSGKACKCSEGGFERKAVEESSQKPGEESSQKPGEESSRPGGVAGVAGKSVTLDDLAAQIIELHSLVAGIAEKFATPAVEKSQSEDITKAVEAIEARVSDIETKAATAVIPARTAVSKAAAANPAVDKAKEYRAKAMATNNPTLAQGYLTLAAELEKSL